MALATSLQSGRAVAVNGGGYKGWFAAWWVVEPRYNDIPGTWAENAIKRLSGLGLVEGYPGTGLSRAFSSVRFMSRTEFAAIAARIADINPPNRTYVGRDDPITGPNTGHPGERLRLLADHPRLGRPLRGRLDRGRVPERPGRRFQRRPADNQDPGRLPRIGNPQERRLRQAGRPEKLPGCRRRSKLGRKRSGQGRPARQRKPLAAEPITRSEAPVLPLRMVRDLGY